MGKPSTATPSASTCTQPTTRYDGQTGDAHVVTNFAVKHNVVRAASPLAIANVFNSAPYTLVVQENTLIQT